MKFDAVTARMVFWLAFLPALVAEATRWVSGVYDTLSGEKLVGVLFIALATATVAGLTAVMALRREEISPGDKSPPENQPP